MGPVYDAAAAKRLARERGWQVAPDGDGWRRVVASPKPLEILEARVVSLLVERGIIVICGGGGGIPVVTRKDGSLSGVEAVIDKDFASELLARQLRADMLLLLTDVDAVYADFGTEKARRIDALSAAATALESFPPGSMRPKIAAAASFAGKTGHAPAIGRLEDAAEIVAGGKAMRISGCARNRLTGIAKFVSDGMGRAP
ncbi:hypothetical protein [Jiella sp. M17.18]|uniref:amino acid kinase family protein n=1 Tax=Jiella sp. M17.18 TaxID=3234247 RepID=UPI0034DEE1F9